MIKNDPNPLRRPNGPLWNTNMFNKLLLSDSNPLDYNMLYNHINIDGTKELKKYLFTSNITSIIWYEYTFPVQISLKPKSVVVF